MCSLPHRQLRKERNQSSERAFIKSISKSEQVGVMGSEIKRVQYLSDFRLKVLDIVDSGKPKGYETRFVWDVKPAITDGMKKLNETQFYDWFASADKDAVNVEFAQLNDVNKIAIGSLTNTVLMSGETAAKQRLKHDDLTAYHYEQLANNINDADVVVLKSDGHKLVFFFIDEKLYEAIVKVTKDKKELYIVSFYRAEK